MELARQNYLEALHCHSNTRTVLFPATTSSLERRLQTIKIFVSAPFGAGVLNTL